MNAYTIWPSSIIPTYLTKKCKNSVFTQKPIHKYFVHKLKTRSARLWDVTKLLHPSIQWNTTQQQKKVNYQCIQHNEWISDTLCQVKDVTFKPLHTMLFHLWGTLSWWRNRKQISSCKELEMEGGMACKTF